MLGRERMRGKTTYVVYDMKFNNPEGGKGGTGTARKGGREAPKVIIKN